MKKLKFKRNILASEWFIMEDQRIIASGLICDAPDKIRKLFFSSTKNEHIISNKKGVSK